MARILLVTNDFGPRAGGIETFVIGLLERVPKGEVLVYTSAQPDSEKHDLDWQVKYGVEVIRDRSKILLPTIRVIRNLRNLIEEREIEAIWIGAAAPLGFAAKWLRIKKVKKIVALTHGHEVWWSKVPPFTSIMRFIGKHIDYFGYLGEFTAAALSRQIRNDKLVKIAPGIDTEHFKPIDVEKSRPTIVSVGRLVHRKGQDRLIEALPAIKREIPDVLLLFVGEGPRKPHMESLISKYGLEENVRFIGRIPYQDLPRFISMGHIFAMPSRSRFFGLEVEGLGIVYLEASACGLPVIGGSSGGAPDAVRQGETGFVVDGNDLQAIANRCIELLKDEELRSRLGENGRNWVEAEWRWEIWSKRFNELLAIAE